MKALTFPNSGKKNHYLSYLASREKYSFNKVEGGNDFSRKNTSLDLHHTIGNEHSVTYLFLFTLLIYNNNSPKPTLQGVTRTKEVVELVD